MSGSAARRPVSEPQIVISLIAITLFLTGLPYLLGCYITPPGMQFVGTAYNIDDYCNYLSWLRQTMDGHFFLYNLFTTEPQKGLEFNVFFWLLGRIAHAAHLSPQAMLQLARVFGGAGLLWLIYRLYTRCLPGSTRARLTAFAFVCLSSGLGWLLWPHWHDKNVAGSPVDAWQPEAYIFLSLYTSALFTVSLLLIVGALYALLLGEQTGQWRYPLIAGVCGAVLGNMHSYDVLHLSAAWGLYLVVLTIIRRGRGVALSWARGIVALGLTLPTTVYQYLIFQREAVFRQRAEVPTLSPAIWHYMLGYGVVFVLAVVGLAAVVRVFTGRSIDEGTAVGEDAGIRKGEGTGSDTDAGHLGLLVMACWAVAGLAVIYLPLAFQRKMLMGEHVPLCLLAGLGGSLLAGHLAPRARIIALTLIVLLSIPSNLLFLDRDIVHLEANRSETSQFPFLSGTLVDTYHWLSENTSPEAAVVGPPVLCAYLPGYTGHAVWAGHWGETPHYGQKVGEFVRFSDSETPDAARIDFLRSTRAQYLLYANDVSAGYVTKSGFPRTFANFAQSPPPYLVPVYRNKDYTLFRIQCDPV